MCAKPRRVHTCPKCGEPKAGHKCAVKRPATHAEREATKRRRIQRDKDLTELCFRTDERYCTGCGQSYKVSEGHKCTSRYSIDLHHCSGCRKVYKLSEGHRCGHLMSHAEVQTKHDQIMHDYYYGNVIPGELKADDSVRKCLDCSLQLDGLESWKVRCYNCWLRYKYPNIQDRKCLDCNAL